MVRADRWFLPSIMLLTGWVSLARAGASPSADKQQILAAWASLSDRISSMRCELIIESSAAAKDKPMRPLAKYTIKKNCNVAGGSGESESLLFDKDGKIIHRSTRCEIANRQYKAVLERSKKDDGWVLVELKSLTEGEKGINYSAQRSLQWQLCGNVPLQIWIADDSFVVEKAQEVHDDRGDLVRMHFAYDKNRRKAIRDSGKSQVPDHIHGGYIDFDPSHFFCVMGYEYRAADGDERGIMEYDVIDGIPVLKAIHVEQPDVRGAKNGVVRAKETRTFKIQYNSSVADAEFRLSHYGLPEPVGVTWPTPVRWYLWFIGGGVISLAIGAFFWRRMQKRQTKSARIPVKQPPMGS